LHIILELCYRLDLNELMTDSFTHPPLEEVGLVQRLAVVLLQHFKHGRKCIVHAVIVSEHW